MKEKSVFSLVLPLIILAACGAMPITKVSEPDRRPIIIASSALSVFSDDGIWRPEVTARWISNYSLNLYAEIRIDAKTGPGIFFEPGETKKIYVDLGWHTAYLKGKIKAYPFGWRELGEASIRFFIDGTPGYREISFSEWNFPRVRERY